MFGHRNLRNIRNSRNTIGVILFRLLPLFRLFRLLRGRERGEVAVPGIGEPVAHVALQRLALEPNRVGPNGEGPEAAGEPAGIERRAAQIGPRGVVESGAGSLLEP
jgi:hypothetical protein